MVFPAAGCRRPVPAVPVARLRSPSSPAVGAGATWQRPAVPRGPAGGCSAGAVSPGPAGPLVVRPGLVVAGGRARVVRRSVRGWRGCAGPPRPAPAGSSAGAATATGPVVGRVRPVRANPPPLQVVGRACSAVLVGECGRGWLRPSAGPAGSPHRWVVSPAKRQAGRPGLRFQRRAGCGPPPGWAPPRLVRLFALLAPGFAGCGPLAGAGSSPRSGAASAHGPRPAPNAQYEASLRPSRPVPQGSPQPYPAWPLQPVRRSRAGS
ncbi:hypothetical protein FHS38_007088 [Streptomyces netropsis]|uniref:Uncharacterized protein n=1 Tax=Streptomyces netropsis TaxID=55404 RepID=A0A7W7LIU6_STRNE|nr:hypothetical protein [Streptomyces netropsis]